MIRALLAAFIFAFLCTPARAEAPRYALNVFAGELTSNHWEEFFNPFEELDFQGTYLVGVSVARNIGHYRDTFNFEIEGQVIKHFDEQDHWEFNGLGVLRWEPFPWDETLDTSFAFGIGPSYATEKPPTEIKNEGDTEKWMVYWMIEFAFSLPDRPQWAVLARLHHRSEAYGVVADKGGSNALVLGLKYRF